MEIFEVIISLSISCRLNSDSYAMIRKHRCEIKEKQKKTLDISSEQEVFRLIS